MEDCFHLGIKGLIRNKEGKILLLQVNVAALHGYKGEAYWDIPGGRIQRGSTVEETLRREIYEETGITQIVRLETLAMVLSKIRIPLKEGGDVGLILWVWICEVGEMEEIKLSDEHVAYEWFESEKAAELLQIKYPVELTEKVKMLS